VREKVSVNPDQCQQVGEILRSIHIRPEFYEREYLTMSCDIESKLAMYLISVGICHQTYKLHSKELNLFGWDYLEHGFIEMARSDSPLLDFSFIYKASVEEIEQLLRPYFTDDIPENCTLDRLDERIGLMKDIAKTVVEHQAGKLWDTLFKKESKLIGGDKGLYQKLLQFEAFADPLFKKSTLLIKFLVEADIIEVIDQKNYIPIMDYHMQRVLLRMACVKVNDSLLKKDLIKRKPQSSDAEVREACIEAIRLTCQVSGHPITIMNDFFWPLGRSCCNETLLCRDHSCEKSPCSFWLMADLKDHSSCVFSEVCCAASDDAYKNYWQPVVKTHFY